MEKDLKNKLDKFLDEKEITCDLDGNCTIKKNDGIVDIVEKTLYTKDGRQLLF